MSSVRLTDDTRGLRVVHYPGEPDDFGVVIREDGHKRPQYAVCWADGYADMLTSGWLLDYGPDLDRPVTVSRSAGKIREAWEAHIEGASDGG